MANTKHQLVNTVTLIGNLGAQAELAKGNSKISWAKARLAVFAGRDDAGNNRPPHWFTIVAFGDLAERMAEFPKGARVRITGRLRTRQYQAQDGSNRTVVEIVATSVKPVTVTRKQQPEQAAA